MNLQRCRGRMPLRLSSSSSRTGSIWDCEKRIRRLWRQKMFVPAAWPVRHGSYVPAMVRLQTIDCSDRNIVLQPLNPSRTFGASPTANMPPCELAKSMVRPRWKATQHASSHSRAPVWLRLFRPRDLTIAEGRTPHDSQTAARAT